MIRYRTLAFISLVCLCLVGCSFEIRHRDSAIRVGSLEEMINTAYKSGYNDGYKQGYVNSLINQEKGTPHDYLLKEDVNGEWRWRKGDGSEVYPYVSYDPTCLP